MKVCRQCGTEIFEGESFCYSCGYSGQLVEYETTPASTSSSNKLIPLLLSLFGLVNIFGLGQLYLRRYFRATIFLCLTAVFLVIPFFYEVTLANMPYVSAMIIVFCAQILDVAFLLFRPQ